MRNFAFYGERKQAKQRKFTATKCTRGLTEYTAISRKVVGKKALDDPESYCGWFCVHSSSSRKFKRMAREAMDVCLRVLKESSKSRFDS